jgi:hypothetical protein
VFFFRHGSRIDAELRRHGHVRITGAKAVDADRRSDVPGLTKTQQKWIARLQTVF